MPMTSRKVVAEHLKASRKPADDLADRLGRWLHEATSVACFNGKGTPWDGVVGPTKDKYRKLANFMLLSETPPPGFKRDRSHA